MKVVTVKFEESKGRVGGHKIKFSLGGADFSVISRRIARRVFSSVWVALN